MMCLSTGLRDSLINFHLQEMNGALTSSLRKWRTRGTRTLYVLKITQHSEDVYFDIGQDNIENLYENILELLLNETGIVEFMKKLKSAEIDLDLPLDNLLK